jgi:hypothetical protein
MSIAEYFSGGIAGFWHNPETGVFTDTAGTTTANPTDAVARINDNSPNGSNSLQSTIGNRPLLSDDGALIFDGTNDCLISSVASNAVNMPFVLAARFTPNAVAATNSGAYRVITRGNSNATRGAICIDNGFVRILTSATVGLNTKAIEIGETVNVIALFESTGTTAWVNGTKYTTTDFIPALASIVPIRIGAQTNNTATTVDRRFEGKLYQHGVLNRSINDAEAAEIDEILTGEPEAPPLEVTPVGILYQTTFANVDLGPVGGEVIDIDDLDFYIFGNTPDNNLNSFVSGGTSGKQFRAQFFSGAERVAGLITETPIPGAGKRLHIAMDLLFEGYTNFDSAIKKVMRFMTRDDGEGKLIATLNAQGSADVGRWRVDLFDSGEGVYDQSIESAALHGPDTFIGTRKRIEFMFDITDLAAPLFAVWVNGNQILSGTGPARTGIESSWRLNGAYILSTFNSPAANASDYIDQIIISDSYIGYDEPEPEEESNGITARGLTASRLTARRMTARGL